MVGQPKHVAKALAQGVDLICAQASEGGGHTGDVPGTLLWPACINECKGKISSFTGQPVYVIAAGGVYQGKGLPRARSCGGAGVWGGGWFLSLAWGAAPKKNKKKGR